MLTSLSRRLLPASIRSFVRGREIGLVVAAALIGAASGLLVAGIAALVQRLHEILFALPSGVRLSGSHTLDPWRAVLGPVIGGAVLALLSLAARPLASRLADAIEANALFGGKLSTRGSLVVTAQTVLSCGGGASVGLEAAYAQICAALASRLGTALAARRADMRLLVACGAAGAIAAAFNAPLAGAFYGFEVVLGTYTVGALAPVATSALVASLIAGRWSEHGYLIKPGALQAIVATDLGHIVCIGVLCSLAGILLMRAVGLSDLLFSRTGLLKPARPVLGGLLVGCLGLVTPQVLGAGHGALTHDLIASLTPGALLGIILLKGAASAVSLGAGFRGGLFYASLLLGALTGRLYADFGVSLDPDLTFDPDLAALTGMAAFGTGVIGAPVTMTALALETTGNFPITLAALIASAIASVIVRSLFGYSFATWRFHLRGEAIRGPHDVGWMRDLAVRKLMRTDIPTVAGTTAIGEARARFPLGALKAFAVTGERGAYLGLVLLDDLYMTAGAEAASVADLMRQQDHMLLPSMTVREALDVFERAESDSLVVVDHPATRRVIGALSESHALRAYGRELERQNPDNVMVLDPLVEPKTPA